MTRRHARCAAWVAALAMALNALWPLIAQAKPANLVPVCTVGGVTHYVEIPGAPAPADSQHEHCAFCFVGVALPTTALPPDFGTFPFGAPKGASHSPRNFFPVSADARGPPLRS